MQKLTFSNSNNNSNDSNNNNSNDKNNKIFNFEGDIVSWDKVETIFYIETILYLKRTVSHWFHY